MRPEFAIPARFADGSFANGAIASIHRSHPHILARM
ncbi:hypothetical protein J2W96_000179 [Variovorax guangxiensis]|nr:hypothetical protein [Variovorax guangxiensis]